MRSTDHTNNTKAAKTFQKQQHRKKETITRRLQFGILNKEAIPGTNWLAPNLLSERMNRNSLFCNFVGQNTRAQDQTGHHPAESVYQVEPLRQLVLSSLVRIIMVRYVLHTVRQYVNLGKISFNQKFVQEHKNIEKNLYQIYFDKLKAEIMI